MEGSRGLLFSQKAGCTGTHTAATEVSTLRTASCVWPRAPVFSSKCVCTHHIYAGVHPVQKMVSDPLKLGLLVVLNHHVVARNLSQSSAKAISTLNH